MTEQVAVTQMDREAAASTMDGEWASPSYAKRLRAGKLDNHHAAQAFARHRLAAHAIGRAEAIAEMSARLRGECMDESTSPALDFNESRGNDWFAGYGAAVDVLFDHICSLSQDGRVNG